MRKISRICHHVAGKGISLDVTTKLLYTHTYCHPQVQENPTDCHTVARENY